MNIKVGVKHMVDAIRRQILCYRTTSVGVMFLSSHAVFLCTEANMHRNAADRIGTIHIQHLPGLQTGDKGAVPSPVPPIKQSFNIFNFDH